MNKLSITFISIAFAIVFAQNSDPEALFNQGVEYYNGGSYDWAAKSFETVLELDPRNSDAKLYLEIIRRERGFEMIPRWGGYVAGIKDLRDNNTYRIVNINGQVWMAENLNYKATGSKCYDNNLANCEIYGRLYDWNTAKSACPSGWHLPSNGEWSVLMNYWSGNGADAYNFTALPGGCSNSTVFGGIGNYGAWWSSTESERIINYAYAWTIFHNNKYEHQPAPAKKNLYSVRCLQDY